MSPKKKAEEFKGKPVIEEVKTFVGRAVAAQEAVDRIEDPMGILDRFGETVLAYCRRLKVHQPYFLEKKINPFKRLQEICREKCLLSQDNFATVAGKKAAE
jgi:hypothetical protein